MMTDPIDAPTSPYAAAAHAYRAAGWAPLPLPLGAKFPPPAGFTGAGGAWPSGADIQSWIDDGYPSGKTLTPAGNLALRLPLDVIGLDIDAYDAKAGAGTYATLIAQHGPLPATWRSSARADGVSGIALYRLPAGASSACYPSELGPGVEIIRAGHRYLVAPPSIHPDLATPYRWRDPAGVPSIATPTPRDLPTLPAAWVAALDAASQATPTAEHPEIGVTGAQQWLTDHHGAEKPCPAVAAAAATGATDLRAGGSRHDVMRRVTARIAHLAAEGHRGAIAGLSGFRATWTDSVTKAAGGSHEQRTPAEAESEWRRALLGAVEIAAAAAQDADPTGCGPFDHESTDAWIAAQGAAPLTTPAPMSQPPAQPGPSATAAPAAASSPTPPAPASTAPQPEPAAPPERERTTWWPVDLAEVLHGDPLLANPPPRFLLRADGAPLLYAGRVNAILGESESGKSWLGQLAVVQALEAGARCLYLDFEGSATEVTSHLRMFGTTDDQLARFAYANPEESWTGLVAEDVAELLTRGWDIVIVDGVNAAMSLLGLEPNSNKDATRFYQVVLAPIAKSGAAVATIDHLPKDSENGSKGAIGAQAKRAMISGCSIRVTVIGRFAPGRTGTVRLAVDKDRPGHVREISAGGRIIGVATIDGTKTSMRISIESEGEGGQDETFRPTVLMERVVEALRAEPAGLTGAAIERAVRGKRDYVRQAVEVLLSEGTVKAERHGQGKLHRLCDPNLAPSPRPRPDLAPGEVASQPRPLAPLAPHYGVGGEGRGARLQPGDRPPDRPGGEDDPDDRSDDLPDYDHATGELL